MECCFSLNELFKLKQSMYMMSPCTLEDKSQKLREPQLCATPESLMQAKSPPKPDSDYRTELH